MNSRSEGITQRAARSYQIIIILWLLAFVSGSQVLIMAPLLPYISEQVAVSESLLGTLITAYAVFVGVFAFVAGPISDRIGRRRILLIGNAIMAIALLLHWVTWDFVSLFVVRALAGVAGGILTGASVAYVGDYFPRERRGWANGWITSGTSAGLIAGIPIGTIVAEQFGFRWPFLAFGVLLAVTIVFLWRYVPQPDVQRADHLTIRSALDGYATLLRRREGLAAVVIFIIMFGGSSLYMTYLPTWLQTTLGVGGGAIATMFFFGGLGTTLGGPPAGTLSDHFGRKRFIIAGSFGIAVLMFVTTRFIVSMWVAYGLFFIIMGLYAARGTPFQTLLAELVASDKRGAFINLTIGMGQIGSGLGGGLAGAAYANVGYEGTTIIAAGATVLTGILIWLFLPETITQTKDGSPPMTSERLSNTGGD
ncbi:MFS transporter [Natronococcus wangiae]|uniref:MFS transporter n=1 Tax=Natronococcus wangiae TaxID=3068275 RepID=UPI00273F3D0C|nr:MFS transporter [Natronococcus sp. AD5]